MVVGDALFFANVVTKFYNTVTIRGWFKKENDRLKNIVIVDSSMLASKMEYNLKGLGGGDTESDLGFSVQVLRNSPTLGHKELFLVFNTVNGWSHQVDVLDLSDDRRSHFPGDGLMSRFQDAIRSENFPTLLDIGGRARSQNDLSLLFPSADVTVLDIIQGENIDVVGDAHRLSSLFPKNSFDFAFSMSVFEHLSMPWKVALELNSVLKIGGLAFISTHQTIGIHDMPCDYFRFSSYSWDGLFNKNTGFEILDRVMDDENFILPFCYTVKKGDAENAAGFEGSSVLVKKISETAMNWPVRLDDIVKNGYPID